MSLVLAIEPDHRQATILKRIVREYVHADLVLVDSRDAAVSALAARIPDVILVTALLSPRDEEELVGYLRGLDGAEHLQTYTIPQLAFTAADSDQKSGGGLFGKFRKKKDADATVGGCDPEHFAEEIRAFIDRATERKNERAASAQQRRAHEEFKSRTEAANPARPAAPKPAADEARASDSAWSDPFAWRPASERASAPQPPRQSAPPSLVTNVPLAVVAEDQEEQAARARDFALEEIAAEAQELARQEVEARAKQEDEERRREEQKRERAEAEAAARRKRDDEERRKREEDERKRLEAEAAARRTQDDEERRKREEDERKKREAEAIARKKREEEERKRLEAEAAARRKREEEERKRLEAEAAARQKREEEERKQLEAEAAARKKREEEERKRLEAEAAARRKREEEERKRRDEEERKRREEEERKRLEAEAAARRTREEEERKRRDEEERRRREEEERKRLEAEAAARRKHEEEDRKRHEEEARKREAEERKRDEARAQRRAEEEEARRREEEHAGRRQEEEARRRERQREIAADSADPFKEFRADHDEPSGVLRLIPVSSWARVERRKSDDEEPAARDEFLQVLSGLRIPQQVAAISYPQGCRIRRVRVRALEQPEPPTDSKSTLIVSRKALQESRIKQRSAGR